MNVVSTSMHQGEVGVIEMTHDFIHTSLYYRFERLPTENVIKRGITVVVFKISDLENVNLHHFRPDVIMAFYGKRTFLGLLSCSRTLILKKTGHIIFSKTNRIRLDDRSLH